MISSQIRIEDVRKPWAVLPETLSTIAAVALAAADRHDYRDSLAVSNPHRMDRGSVAVIPIRGIISRRPGLFTQIFGGSSVTGLTSMIRSAVSDSGVSAIILDVDSPGGAVEGVPELADEIRAARAKKKIVAVANGIAASAAYWLASQANEVAITPSGQLGAIGIFAIHEDVSRALDMEGVKISLISSGKYKTDGNSYEPLSTSARSDMQQKCDAFYSMFANAVARGRGADPSTVRSGFGEGRLVLAKDAVRLGMADRIATLDETVAAIFSRQSKSARAYGRSVDLLSRELDLLSPRSHCAGSRIAASRPISALRRELALLSRD